MANDGHPSEMRPPDDKRDYRQALCMVDWEIYPKDYKEFEALTREAWNFDHPVDILGSYETLPDKNQVIRSDFVFRAHQDDVQRIVNLKKSTNLRLTKTKGATNGLSDLIEALPEWWEAVLDADSEIIPDETKELIPNTWEED